jgi:hypothetical protein
MTFAAGATLQASLRTGSTCPSNTGVIMQEECRIRFLIAQSRIASGPRSVAAQ